MSVTRDTVQEQATFDLKHVHIFLLHVKSQILDVVVLFPEENNCDFCIALGGLIIGLMHHVLLDYEQVVIGMSEYVGAFTLHW